VSAMPAGLIDAIARAVPRRMRPPQVADKVKKLAAILPLDDEARYLRLVSQCPDPAALTRGIGEHAAEFSDAGEGRSFAEQMQMFDTATYLPDDILQKVDRASMAVSLEVRPPLLDHRVVAFAWRLPRHLRMRGGESKWLLRRVLQRYVPPALTDRPKMGFGVPLAAWLRGPLRDWVEDLLDPASLGGGLFDATAMRELWRQHLSGEANWAYALWTILMYEAWRRRWAANAA